MKFVNKISPMTTEWKEGHQCLMKSIGVFGFAVLAIFKIGFSVFVPENFGFYYLGPVSLRSERKICVSTDLE